MNNRKYYEANGHECSLIRWRMRVRQAVAARGTLDRDFSGGRGAIGRAAPPKRSSHVSRNSFPESMRKWHSVELHGDYPRIYTSARCGKTVLVGQSMLPTSCLTRGQCARLI